MYPLQLAMLSSFEIVLLLGVALAFVAILPILAFAAYALIRSAVRAGVRDAQRSDQNTTPPR
jgi:hypothetical protein